MILANRILIVDCHNCGDRFPINAPRDPCPRCGWIPTDSQD